MCSSLLSVNILSASMTSPCTTSVQLLFNAIIVKDGYRLPITVALQLHTALYAERGVCVHACFNASVFESSKKPTLWIFLSLFPLPWFLKLEHPGKFDFQGHSDVHTPQPQFLFFLCLLSLLTKTQRGISSTIPPWRWRPSSCSLYVINFSPFIKAKPLAHRWMGEKLSHEMCCISIRENVYCADTGCREEVRKAQREDWRKCALKM